MINIRSKLLVILTAVLLLPDAAFAKIKNEFGDSTKTHVFTLSAELLTRGEYMQGALPVDTESVGAFILERTRISLNYKQPHLEIQITPQHIGAWGTTGGGAFNLREAWAQGDVYGFFAKVGRQTLSYDDERVIGLNDWSLTGTYHDALKLGYEGYGHKIHLIGAYCQNNSNLTGGLRYVNGNQPYKHMEALWYHYDFKRWFSASLLFVNSGMQSVLANRPNAVFCQQMAGTYVRFRYDGEEKVNAETKKIKDAWWFDMDASFYYQFGRTNTDLPIRAWMLAVEAKSQINRWVQLNTGYFYLSGDENYTVPPRGGLGFQNHVHEHSFNLLYASHHKFYGAMDFFYLQSYFAGYSPGLQDWHLGGTFLYKDQFDFTAKYHALATTVPVKTAPSILLGHELELTASYRPAKWVTLSASYTFMQGTKTMETVKRSTDRNQSHWVYLMVVFHPTLVKVRF